MFSQNEMIRGLRYVAAIGIVLLIILGFGLRLYRPAADPPRWLYVYNTDEGHYSYNTHNKAKYGHWFVNEAKYALITPLFNLAQYLAAEALPNQPDIVRYRAISILCGVLFCFALRYLFGPGFIQWTSVALGSISFISIVHSRLGIPEMMLTLGMLVTALLAIEGEKRRSFVLYVMTGVAAVACVAIKPTGVLILTVLITVPLLCRKMGSSRNKYFLGIVGGILLGGAVFFLIVVLPQPYDWLKTVSAATSFGRSSFEPTLLGIVGSLSSFFLSRAMQTMPILWPMALCWCIFVVLPRLTNRQNEFQETLLFLWLCFGIAMLGLVSYQPARWQLLIFPPVIAAGVRFLRQIQSPVLITTALTLAVIISVASSLDHGGGLLRLEGEIDPGHGVFSHGITFVIASLAFLLPVLTARVFHGGWRTGVLCGALLLEITVQLMLHSVYMKPTYFRESQWGACSRALEALGRSESDLFAGSMVQDLSLHSNIRVLPTYYALDETNNLDDSSVRDFFVRQSSIPRYFLLLDIEHPLWAEKAPIFMSNLEAIERCQLLVGGIGLRNLQIYRFKSYDWLK
jgi:hypothetical protein